MLLNVKNKVESTKTGDFMLLNVKTKVESTKTGSFVLLNGRARTGTRNEKDRKRESRGQIMGIVEIIVMLNKVKHL